MGLARKILALHERINTPYVRVDHEAFSDWPDVTHPTPGLNRTQVIAKIQSRNPRRWRRLMRDFEWAKREMVRLGRNPEDVRFLL